jgi:hypothetical protein
LKDQKKEEVTQGEIYPLPYQEKVHRKTRKRTKPIL